MNHIKLSKKYSLSVPLKLEYKQITNILENKLNLKIHSKIGLNDSYSISILDNNSKFIGTLYIDTLRIKGVWITKIKQLIEGRLVYDKEIYEDDCDLLLAICNELKGLFICEEDGLKNTISYAINYDKDSLDYKLIETLIDEIQDPLETLALVQILKNKKNELSSVLLCDNK